MRIFTKKQLLTGIILLIAIFGPGTEKINAAISKIYLGNLTISNTATTNDSGIGWNWNAATSTLTLNSEYAHGNIAYLCDETDHFYLVYSGNVSIFSISSSVSAIMGQGTLHISGDGGVLTLNANEQPGAYCIDSQKHLIIEGNAEINTISRSDRNAITCFGNLTIKDNASVTMTAGTTRGSGLIVFGNLLISTTGIVNARSFSDPYSYSIQAQYATFENKGTINVWAYGNRHFSYAPVTTWENVFFDLPIIKKLNPNTGNIAGGSTVVLTGEYFQSYNITKVKVGGIEATDFTVDHFNQITFTTPAGTAGTVDVVVERNDGAKAILKKGFTYTSSTGIFDTNDTKTNIYLNPSDNVLHIDNLDQGMLQIINSSGAIIVQKASISVAESIDLNHLTQGMYVVSIIEKGKNSTKKIMVGKRK